jgi:3-isopropylmalate/(R)-2-methylmalate dehydratase large subunit
MGMTAVEKVLARASGAAAVAPWDVVYPEPELVFVHDGHVEGCKRELDALGITRLKHPERVVFATDHEVIYLTPRAAERGANIRKAAREWRVGRFFDVGQGGHGHIFPMETGLVTPGMFVFASDMHCSNFGAIGAVPVRAGPEVVSVLAMGTLWTTVPPSVKVNLNGAFAPGVYGRDAGYKLAWALARGPHAIDVDYRYLELNGSALAGLSINDRVALCNTPTEIGVAGVFIPPSARILAWCRERAQHDFEPVRSDADASYEAVFNFDVSSLQPQVALPGSPANAVDIAAAGARRVDHAYLGSCGSGMYEDFVIAADLLRGRRVATGTRLFVVPGTVQSARRLTESGLMGVFQDAGAVVLPPGCGPCAGGNMGLMHSGEVSISTAATNHVGRMGARDAECYLGSPATVAASAVAGCITDPREFLGVQP